MFILFYNGIDVTGFGLQVCSELEAFSEYGSKTPIASKIKESCIFIPIHEDFNKNDMKHLAQTLNLFYDGLSYQSPFLNLNESYTRAMGKQIDHPQASPPSY